jgi:hypothetical protein
VTVLEDRPRRLPIPVERAPDWLRLAVPAVVVLAAVHVAVVSGHYVVGSFDDDGHYLALAKAFAHGRGYVDTSIPGAPVETLYPPGYPLLLTPLVWLAGSALWPLRVLSAVAFLGCFPLLDRLMRRHEIATPVRLAALVLLALNPTAATFGSEVMPESVFLLVLLAVLLALPRWEGQGRTVTWAGAVVALGAPYLFLLKTAGLPMLAGVLGWLLLRRRWRQLVASVVCAVVVLLPMVLVRLSTGPVVGQRYTSEYGMAGPLPTAVWHGVRTYLTDAVSATLVPTEGAGLHGHLLVLDALLAVLRFTAAPLVIIGLFAWWRRRLDVTVLIVPLYLAETVPFVFVNQRRVVLLLPLVVAAYAIGWAAMIRWLRRRSSGHRTQWMQPVSALPAVLVLPLLAWQFPRDYLLHLGESTPASRGSGYVAALREVTPAGWSIGTGYQWSIADLTGRTATNVAHQTTLCSPGHPADPARIHHLFTQNHVAAVLDAWLKWPYNIDNPCVFDVMRAASWAVPVYHGTDASTVFVLIGPQTPRADLHVALDQPTPAGSVAKLARITNVTELSVAVSGLSRPELQVHSNASGWVTVPSSLSAPGKGPRLLHARLATPVEADAVRVLGASGLRDLVVLAANP